MERRTRLLVVAFATILAAVAATASPDASSGRVTGAAAATATPTTFSGRAVGLQGTIANLPPLGALAVPCLASNPTLGANCRGVADTGPLDVTSPEPPPLEQSLVCYAVPDDTGCLVSPPNLTGNALSAEAFHTAVVARGNKSTAEASVAEFSFDSTALGIAGAPALRVSADVLHARASATCTGQGAVVQASGETTVTVNGTTYTVAAGEERKIGLNPVDPLDYSLGFVIVNPGASGPKSGNTIDAAALRIVIPATGTDLTVAAVHADIVCGRSHCPGKHAFVTSGGYILLNGAKAHFAAAGRNLSHWGHVLYRPGDIHVKDPYALVFGRGQRDDLAAEAAARGFTANVGALDAQRFEGGAVLTWTGQNGSLGQALLVDMGEPGRGDVFEIVGVVGAGAGTLAGGNVQMHGSC